MLRVILFALMLVAFAIFALALLGVLRAIGGPMPASKEDKMPANVRTIAYVLLIILMFGVVSGMLGAA